MSGDAERKAPSGWSALLATARAAVQKGDLEGALSACTQAAVQAPHEPSVWRELAIVHRYSGAGEASQAALKRLLELKPGDATALRLVGYEHRFSRNDELFAQVLAALLHVERYPQPSQVEVYYAAAKAYEDLGEIDAAFALYARAGALQKNLCPWSDVPLRRLLDLFKTQITADSHSHWRRAGFTSSKPIFAVGMPRSGTTLVEQIVASHPDAHGAGELKLAAQALQGWKLGTTVIHTGSPGPFGAARSLFERGRAYVKALEALSPAPRIVDKLPGNYVWLGVLDAMIPGSKFIHCRRHPVATCLSAYRLYFGREVHYAYDLRDLGKAYRLYHEIMAFWTALIQSDCILHVRYEDLVLDTEGQVRRILGFLDLPWCEACLHFHRSPRMVRTASALQVRRPIYRSSGESWKGLERYLQALLDELGDLVAFYEQ